MFFQVSGNAIINVIVGGTGTLIGALYGSAILTVLRSVIGSFTAHHQIVIGIIFMVSVIFFPKGLIGYLLQAMRRRADKSKGQA
jgi:branched-chain amino acid transport system permease protein